VTPVVAHDGQALKIPMETSGDEVVLGWAQITDPVLLTQPRLSFYAWTDASIWDAYLAVIAGVEEGFTLWPGGWNRHEMAVGCGSEVVIELHGTGLIELPFFVPSVYVDDFVLTGGTCAEYTDGDGDGYCTLGQDLDGDGSCTGAGEPTSWESYLYPYECDDTQSGRHCLTLSAGEPVPGATVSITAMGALPGDMVVFLGARKPGSWCPRLLGGSCVDLKNPRRLGIATADDLGVAVLEVEVPAETVIGESVWFQAVALRTVEPAEVSPALQIVYTAP
jgi:hypothetical protein